MSAKTQRERKMRISDGLTLAMGRIGWITLLVILGIGLPVYGLWALFGQFDYAGLRWLAVGLVAALAPVFGLGFFFGKVEVRGFLGGFDRALDGLARAVDLRDTSKERRVVAAAPRPTPPDPNSYLPPVLPPITPRVLSQSNVLDL